MKNKKKNVIVLIIGVVLVALLVLGGFLIFGKKSDAARFKEEYESLNGVVREKDKQTIRTINIDKDNPFIFQSANDIIDRIKNKETFAVYFGFADCPWCRSVIPSLVDVSKDMNVGVIYYVDVKNIRDTLEVDEEGKIVTTFEGGEGYRELVELLDNVLSDYTLKDKDGENVETGKKRIYAPNLVVVTHGMPVALETGISESETNAYMDLTDEMKDETYNAFKNALDKLSGNGGVCGPETGC